MMKAITQSKYGSPDALEFQDVDKPAPGENDLLVSVRAAGLNPADWHAMTGTPFLVRIGGGGVLKPKRNIPGLDLAGVVEEVGVNVTEFRPGDEVFGEAGRGLAEYAVVSEKRVVLKPDELTFEQAAAVPIAAITALQALRDKGQVEPGQKVLVVGASGGVGTFAVQLAKSLGAEVTAVCSTRNVEMVAGLGADSVVDYSKEDFTKLNERYDVVLDMVGNQSVSDCKRVLAEDGTYVGVGGPKRSHRLLGRMFAMIATSIVGDRKMVSMLAKQTKEDLAVLSELLGSGELTPVIDRTYSLDEAPDAFRYLGEGHAQGKVVIIV